MANRGGGVSIRSEHALQASCVDWFRYQYADQSALLFAIPNGGARNAITGAFLKKEGVVAGVADLFYAVPHMMSARVSSKGKTIWHGCFIEMKLPNGRLSKPQHLFARRIVEAGYRYEVVRNIEEFIILIKWINDYKIVSL